MLADEDVEDDAVDAVVLAVEGDGADDVARLAEAVDAAFALFVAGGVPGEVVVDDGVEVVLEVDAFGQAVGGDQDVAARSAVSSAIRPRAARRWQVPGDGCDVDVASERCR